MTKPVQDEELLTAAECARRLGVTARSLRLYEARGLIAPRRSAKGWRHYGPEDVARIHEILALKRFGLSLRVIARLLAGRPSDIDHTLAMQQAVLRRQQDMIAQSLALIAAATAKRAAGEEIPLSEIVKLTKDLHMPESSLATIAQRRYDQARPRTAVSLNPAIYDRHIGHYQFDSGVILTVSRDSGRLYVRTPIWPRAKEILPESETDFFLPNELTQLSFVTGDGPVSCAAIWRSGGFDVELKRLEEDEAKRAFEELATRIERKLPWPRSEEILRSAISELQAGTPDFTRYVEPHATWIRHAAKNISAEIGSRGAIRDVRYKGVGRGGGDIYDVRFEDGELEWRMRLAPDGRIGFLYYRLLP